MLSKSDFIHKYLECPCALWLAKKRPELLPQEIDANLQRIFDEGNRVDEEAKKLYPRGFEVAGRVREGWKNTQRALESRSEALFQPTVISGDLHCRADILTRNGKSAWDIREVKSSGSVKEKHIFDLAFQYLCFEGAEVEIKKTYLVHLDMDYVRHGAIDPQELFIQEDVTASVRASLSKVRERIGDALEVAEWPRIPGAQNVNACVDPKSCEYLGLYLHELPEALRLKYEKMRTPVPLPDPPEIRIDPVGVRRALRTLEYPAYFLDYETYSPAIPMFDGYSPYQRVVFQYSLHVQAKPGARTTHFEYLEREPVDPTPRLAAHLREHVGKEGSFVAWFAIFEKGCNKEMGERDAEFREFFRDVNSRMYDPLYIFKYKRGLYLHSGFEKSASLKKVLPALVPSLSYKALAIQEGETASNSWPTLIDKKTLPETKARLAKDMLAYCGLDTLGMVKIVDHLQEVAS